MTRNLKALGLCLLAVFSTCAIAAQGASAHKFELTKGTSATLTADDAAHEDHFFTGGTKGAKVTCKSSTFTGTQGEKTKTEVTLTPTYSECSSPVGGATVTNSGCKYTFFGETTEDPVTKTQSAPVSLTCGHPTSVGSITIETGGCTLHFSDTHETVGGEKHTVNQKMHGVVYEQKGEAPDEHLTVKAHVSAIKYVATGANCALLGISVGTHDDGTYLGNTTVKAYETGQTHDTAHQVGVNLAAT